MPNWMLWILNKIVIPLLVKFGLPVLVTWLKKTFPGVDWPFEDILSEHAKEMSDIKVLKKVSRRKAQARMSQRLDAQRV